MKKIDLKKLENLMIKNYKRQISFQELQKNFFENDIERIKYIKSKLEKAYIRPVRQPCIKTNIRV